ncbi:MAG: FitA-like ribbon-helix-helix domain-containing protein [Actinomycetota bacterium]
MCCTCATLYSMSKMIQVRNVSDELHAELLRRAKLRGRTLTAYIEEILERETSRPPAEEVFARIKSRRPIPLGRPAADLIHEEREEMERKWDRLWPTLRRSPSTSQPAVPLRRSTST